MGINGGERSMVTTGAKPQKAVERAEKKKELLSMTGNLIIETSPLLKGGQIMANAAARSGNFEMVKEMAKAKMRQSQQNEQE